MTTTTTLTISVTEQVFVANVMKVTMPIFQAHTDSLSRHTRVDDDLLHARHTEHRGTKKKRKKEPSLDMADDGEQFEEPQSSRGRIRKVRK